MDGHADNAPADTLAGLAEFLGNDTPNEESEEQETEESSDTESQEDTPDAEETESEESDESEEDSESEDDSDASEEVEVKPVSKGKQIVSKTPLKKK